MEGVGFEGLAVVFDGDAGEGAGTPKIDGHGDEHHGKRPDGRFNFDLAEEKAHDGFVNDPGAGDEEQASFDEG